jgi:arylsulfatase A-like enzyme
MNRKSLRALALLSSLSLALGLAWWWLRPRPENVVVVVIDTLRSDHLATYGARRQTAPFLDRLAREGAVFDGLSPTSWTKPATASLLTGLHPLRHQAVGRLDALPDQVVTLAERLRAEKYQTLGVSANGWISGAFGFDQGFIELILQDSVAHAEDVNTAFLPLLDNLKPPFFLYVHYIDPHAPYEPRTAWDGGELPTDLRAQGPVTIESLDPFSLRQRPPELLARARDLYDGEIRGADRGLEQLVGALQERGLLEDTVLVVTSDHGEEMEEHGRMSHGLSLYEEVVRVPLVFHAPHHIPPGRRGRASLLDVVPTLMDFLDLGSSSEAAGLDGVSLAAALRGGTPAADPRAFLFHLDHIDGTSLALTRGRDKIVLGRRPYHKELFDLDRDPRERRNLLGQGAEEAFARLAADLAETYNDSSSRALPRRTASLDEALESRLAALGYVAPRRAGDPRRIPRRIAPADGAPAGLLGWEAVDTLPSCFDLAAPEADRHLLRGWHEPETRGRWSKQTGVVLLGAPPGGGRSTLVLAGRSHRPDTPRVTVSLAQRPLLEAPVPPGEFQLTVPIDRLPASGPLVLEIATDGVFQPAQHDQGDARSLGLFLTSICLQPAGSPGMIPVATVAR